MSEMKKITMSMISLPKEDHLDPQSARQQIINNIKGFLHFLDIQNIKPGGIWERGFYLNFEIPEEKVKRFLWLFHLCGLGMPQGYHILSICPQEGGLDLRASTPEEEALADWKQRMRVARDRGKYLPIGS